MKLNTLFEGFSKQIYSKPNESSDDDSALAASSTKTLLKTENEKYRLLLDDSIEWKGHTLYRIQYKKKFVSSDGYINAISGYLGGYIESLDNLSEEGGCAILHEAKVWGNARVFGDAWIDKNAEVFGNSKVYDKAEVFGNSKVYGNAEIYGNAWVYGNAEIYGNSKIYGDAQIHGYVHIRNEDIGSGNIA